MLELSIVKRIESDYFPVTCFVLNIATPDLSKGVTKKKFEDGVAVRISSLRYSKGLVIRATSSRSTITCGSNGHARELVASRRRSQSAAGTFLSPGYILKIMCMEYSH